jgi:hypothetical protein
MGVWPYKWGLAIPDFGIDTHMIECSAFTVTAVASTMAKVFIDLM